MKNSQTKKWWCLSEKFVFFTTLTSLIITPIFMMLSDIDLVFCNIQSTIIGVYYFPAINIAYFILQLPLPYYVITEMIQYLIVVNREEKKLNKKYKALSAWKREWKKAIITIHSAATVRILKIYIFIILFFVLNLLSIGFADYYYKTIRTVPQESYCHQITAK